MSWKIYEAYRLRKGTDLFAFVRDVRPKLERAITRRIAAGAREVLKLMNELRRSDPRELRQMLGTRDGQFLPKRLTEAHALEYIHERFKAEFPKATWGWYGMDVSIAIREHRGYLYLIPHANGCMARVARPILERHPALTDFHYQDQSDPPKGVRGYSARGKVWAAMEGNNESAWHDVLALELLTPNSYWRLRPDMVALIRTSVRNYERREKRRRARAKR